MNIQDSKKQFFKSMTYQDLLEKWKNQTLKKDILSCEEYFVNWMKSFKKTQIESETFFYDLILKYHYAFCNDQPFDKIKHLVDECIQEFRKFTNVENLYEHPNYGCAYSSFKKLLLDKWIDCAKYQQMVSYFYDNM